MATRRELSNVVGQRNVHAGTIHLVKFWGKFKNFEE